MELKKALSILNLNYNCTEEDLRNAYRRLIKEYHPDKFTSEEEKEKAHIKTQEINEAKAKVNEYIKTRNECTKGMYDDINKREIEQLKALKAQYLNEALIEINYISSISSPDIIFSKWYESFRELLDDFYSKITKQSNVLELENTYQRYRNKYFDLIIYYLYDHWKVNKITSFVNGDMKITKETSLEEVRDKMLEIINNILDSELTKYKYIEDYNVLEPLLIGIRRTHALTCLWGQFDINTTKKELKKHLMFTINKYYKRKKLLEELIEVDGELLPHSIELQNVILSEKEFYTLYNQIDKPSKTKSLVRKIAKHFNQKTKKQIEK